MPKELSDYLSAIETIYSDGETNLTVENEINLPLAVSDQTITVSGKAITKP